MENFLVTNQTPVANFDLKLRFIFFVKKSHLVPLKARHGGEVWTLSWEVFMGLDRDHGDDEEREGETHRSGDVEQTERDRP